MIMRLFTVLAFGGALLGGVAQAQGISQKVAVCNPAYTGRCIAPNADGSINTVPAAGGVQSGNLSQVNGQTVNVGAGAAGAGTQRVITSSDSANSSTGTTAPGTAASASTLAGGLYNSTPPTFANGQGGALQFDSRGNTAVVIRNIDGTQGVQVNATAGSDTQSNTATSLNVRAYGEIWDGSQWVRGRSIVGADGAGLGVAATAIAPHSAAAGAASQCFVVTSSAQCGTAAAHNFYMAEGYATADTYVYVFNSTSAPTSPSSPTFGSASGNYSRCFKIPTGTSASIGSMVIPTNFTAGIYIGQSSTACGLFTAATTAQVTAFYK